MSNDLLITDVLQDAGLINQKEIEEVLKIQKNFPEMELERILTIRGKVSHEIIVFFSNHWSVIKQKGGSLPIGFYFQKACLVSEKQVQEILIEQKNSNLKFGEIAISKSFLSRITVDFFLQNLAANPFKLLSFDELKEYDRYQLRLERKYADPDSILVRVLAWAGGHPALTIDICDALGKIDLITTKKEFQVVDQLITNAVIKNWCTNKLGRSIRFIKKGIDDNQNIPSVRLWEEYREVLLKEYRLYKKTEVQNELLKKGLVILQNNNQLRVGNFVFSQVFNQDYINTEIIIQEIKSEIYNNPDKPIKAKSDLKKQESDFNINKKNWLNISRISFFFPLFLIMSVVLYVFFQSSTTKKNQPDAVQQERSLEKYCVQINISDSSSRLNSIFKLEQEKKILRSKSLMNLVVLPDICDAALNKMRMLAIPDLGRDNNVIEALGFLCSISVDSEFSTEATVWLHRWYSSPTWDETTKKYLKTADSCPLGKELLRTKY